VVQPGLTTWFVQWEETQDNLKLNLQRSLYGMHLPVRQLMERKVVGMVWSMSTISVTLINVFQGGIPGSRSNIHMDILMGRDESLDVGDFYGGRSQPLLINSYDI
jgi:proteasome maturation protein